MGILTLILAIILLIVSLSAASRFIGCIFSANSREKIKKQPILHFIWAILSILIILALFTPTGGHPPFIRKLITCRHNLIEIGIVCKLHSEENNGKWPAQLTDLIPKYIPANDKDIINCPVTNMQYTYTQPKPDSPSDTVIITCTQHNKGLKYKKGLILYKNGDVKGE